MTSGAECLNITKRNRRIVSAYPTDILHLQDTTFAFVAESTAKFPGGMDAYVVAAMRGEWKMGLMLRWVTDTQMTCDATVNPDLSGENHLSNLNGEPLRFGSLMDVRCPGHEDVPVFMLYLLPRPGIILRQGSDDEDDDTETR
jgi:hypothetical protein